MIQELLPHRPPIVLIETLGEVTGNTCLARMQVDPNAWYANSDGAMPAWYGLELMAQTAAALAGHINRAANRSPKVGYLLGTRHYDCKYPLFKGFEHLEVIAKMDYANLLGQSVFDCEIRIQGATVASALLKVFEKNDPVLESPGGMK